MLAERGATVFLDEQLDPDTTPGAVVELLGAVEARGERIAGDVGPRGDAVAARRRAAVETLGLRTLIGAAWSERQLEALLADFWSNHLHVTLQEQPELFWAPSYDLDVIRADAISRRSVRVSRRPTRCRPTRTGR